MRFGDKFISSQHPQWSEYYINYTRLKQLIYPLFDLECTADARDCDDNVESLLRDEHLSSDRKLPDIKTSREFQEELNNEIQKALLFLLRIVGEIASDLSELSDEFNSLSAKVQLQFNRLELLQQIHALRMAIIDRVASKLLLLLEFIELNEEAITKIIKKHDKAVASWESSSAYIYHHNDEQPQYQRLRTQYLPRFAVYSSNANVRCMFLIATDAGDTNSNSKDGSNNGFGGFNAIQFNLERILTQLHKWEGDMQEQRQRSESEDVTLSLIAKPPVRRRSLLQIWDSRLGHRGEDDFQMLSSKSLSFGFDLNLSGTHQQSKVPDSPFFEPMLYRIKQTRMRLGQSTNRYNKMVYAYEMLGYAREENGQLNVIEMKFGSIESMQRLRRSSIEGDEVGPPSPIVSRLSKLLNLASSALYMCNYNVTTPTSGLYAKRLGFDEAHAGIIIGMTPTAVIFSSVLYSWWSSYSYKRALIFASSCCAIGNLIYAFALPCDSLTMVLLGRLMTGFGSARSINRRYIADYYSIEERTAGMADFVSASAFGMAVGPGLAAFLSFVTPSGKNNVFRWWTVETAPGYIMFGLWCIYLCGNILFFEEPDRLQKSFAKEEKVKQREKESLDERTPLKLTGSGIPMDKVEESLGYLQWLKQSLIGSIPVSVCLLLLVLLKAVLEGLTSSTPTVSRFYFDWRVHTCGSFLAILASLMIPANMLVAHISRRFDDREIILAMLCMMAIGIGGFMAYASSEASFVSYSLIIFIACNALEGPTMGLLSKVIPKTLANGVFNAGLLATEAGTLGRVVGDFWLTAAAHGGIDNLVDALFGPLILFVAVCVVITLWSYSRLQPTYDDEDDD